MQKYAGWLFAVLVLAAVGCSSTEKKESTSSDPAEFCPDECARRVATHCNTPENYQAECELLCRGRYTKYPKCDAALQSYDACSRDKITYTCVGNAFHAQPQGACAGNAQPCYSCTGDLLGCAF